MLGLPPLPRTLDAALRDIEHERQHVRLSALRDLVRLARGPARLGAIQALGSALLRDASAEIRTEAAMALADCEAREARDELLAALEDAHVRVRQMAVLALGEVAAPGDAEVVEALRPLLGHEEPALRFQALIAFEALAGKEAERALVRASEDPDDEVRAMAFRLSDRRFENETPPAALLDRARSALGAKSAASATAALFLAAHAERAADQVLLGVLEGKVPAGTNADMQAVMEAVADLGLEAARPALARRAFGVFGVRPDALGWQGCIALCRLGDERARHAILRGLSAWTRDGRTLAVVAAGRAGLVAAREAIRGFRGDPSRADPEAVEEALSRLEPVE
jgi:HEAT repeat protein